ncbi:MAG: 4Fe-4S double cluster binding domain-containing protein, partial [Desulfovibrio sp.]
GIATRPENLLAGFSRAVSLALHISDAVVDMIEDVPTPLYHEHYQVVNGMLDRLATQSAFWLQEHGWSALPIPASKTIDTKELQGAISHKAVAVAAGIGWQGKSLLTVSPQFGPRIRLVSILTDAPLAPDEPLRNRCAGCSACADACPVGAIRNVNTESHYESREAALFFERCKERVMVQNMRLEHIDHPICGVCIRACPWGKVKKSRRPRQGDAPAVSASLE